MGTKDRSAHAIGNLGKILLKWVQGALEILTFFPIAFTLGLLLISEEIWIWLFSLWVLHLVGLILGKALQGKPRYVYWAIAFIISRFIGLLVSPNLYTRILVVLGGLVMFIRGIYLRGRRWSHMFPPSILWIGLVIYLIMGAIYRLVPDLKPYFPYLTWTGLSYMIIAFLVINLDQLRGASLSGAGRAPTLPSNIIKNNRILVLLTLGLVLVIGFFNDLREGATKLAKGIFNLIVRFILFLTNLFYQPTTGMDDIPKQESTEMFPMEVKEPSWILRLLEMLAGVVAGIILLILLWYGFKIIFRQLKKLYVYLSRIFKDRLFLGDDGGFIDEKESLVNLGDMGRDYMDRFQRWIESLMNREPKWEELGDNRQRIRFLYRAMLFRNMKEGYPYKGHLTPKETGQDILRWNHGKNPKVEDLIGAYDMVRYGKGHIEDHEVEKLAKDYIKS